MNSKKALGYIFYGIAVLLCLSIVGRLGKFLGDIVSLFKIFSSDINGLQRGQIIGSIVFWIFLIVAIYSLFKYGNKFIKNKDK